MGSFLLESMASMYEARAKEGAEPGCSPTSFEKKQPIESPLGLSSALEHRSFEWSRLTTDIPSELDIDHQVSGWSLCDDPDVACVVSKEQIEDVICSTVASLRYSIAISDPLDQDLSLKMVSKGFEELTGYSRHEMIGRNCRLLNQGCTVDPLDLLQMRVSCSTGAPSTVMLTNRRKWGGFWHNLLFLSGLSVAQDTSSGNDLWYIVGIQMELNDSDVNGFQAHAAAMQKLAEEVRAKIGEQLGKLTSRHDEANSPDPPDVPGGCPRWCTLTTPKWRTGRHLGSPTVRHADPKIQVETGVAHEDAVETEKVIPAIRWADPDAEDTSVLINRADTNSIKEAGVTAESRRQAPRSSLARHALRPLLATAALAAASAWLLRFACRKAK
mmetsp:Transcript_101390/g.295393  ORF Transcript_101390/g.295393 Transcript_101390/m.295393 type:complete len:385 (+) Transcript_101390:37-1191(+)